MGPLYLIRLLRLRDKRKAALDQLLLRPLRLRDDCHWRKMKSITEAYRHMTGHLVWEAREDVDVVHDHHWCTYNICTSTAGRARDSLPVKFVRNSQPHTASKLISNWQQNIYPLYLHRASQYTCPKISSGLCAYHRTKQQRSQITRPY